MPSTESEKQFMDLSRNLEAVVNELKKMNLPSIKQDIKKQGDIIQRSLGNVKGSFRRGGTTDEDGDFLVGENGAEVVSLPKGSSIIPLDVSDLVDGLKNVSQLREDLNDKVLNYDKSKRAVVTPTGDYDIDFLKSQLEKQMAEDKAMNVGDDGSGAKAVSALGKLQEKIKKSAVENKEGTVDQNIGKKSGPTPDEIKAERERLLAEDPEFYSDPKNLQDEIDSYISSYNFGPGFSFSKTKEPELAVKEKPKAKEESAEKAVKEKPKREKKEKEEGEGLFSKAKGKLAGKVNKASLLSTGISLLEKKTGIKDKAVELGAKVGLSKERSEKLLASANLGTIKSVKTLAKKFSKPKGLEEGESKIVNEKPNLNPPVKPAPAQTETKATSTAASAPEKPKSEKSEAASKSGSTESGSSSGGSTSTASASKSASEPQLSKDDVNDIKSLLSKISSTLAGPLNVSASEPFRPDSRRI